MCSCCRGTPTYVCFDCRFVTKRLHVRRGVHRDPRCSSCGQELIRFGRGDFATPTKRDDRGWKKLKSQYLAKQKAEERRKLEIRQYVLRRQLKSKV
jgi:hypothetical protein